MTTGIMKRKHCMYIYVEKNIWLDCSFAKPPCRWSFLQAQRARKARFSGEIVHVNVCESIYSFDYFGMREKVSRTDESYLLSYQYLIRV